MGMVAMCRGRTLYLPWGKVPMFPLDLSDGVFSLSADKHRNCLTFYANLAKDGSVEDMDVKAHRVKCVRMTYDEVDACMSSPPAQNTNPQVQESLQVLKAKLST
jgi:exoribonuclease II